MILLFERTVHKSLSKFDLAVFNFPRRVSRCLLAVSSSSILVADSRFWKVENQRYINIKNQETCTEKSYKNQFFTWIKFWRKFSWNLFHGKNIIYLLIAIIVATYIYMCYMLYCIVWILLVLYLIWSNFYDIFVFTNAKYYCKSILRKRFYTRLNFSFFHSVYLYNCKEISFANNFTKEITDFEMKR